MEFGILERELYVDASPEVVFEVISRPEKQGWELAVLEVTYEEHVEGWDRFLPQLREYAARVGSVR